MKIDIISDIHLTADRDHGKDFVYTLVPEGTVLILAGDVGEFHWWLMNLQMIRELCSKYEQVLWIAGNHDYYGTTLEEGKARFREVEARIDNFYFLDQDIIEIDGVKFAGSTLWFKDGPTNQFYEGYMNDFRMVRDFKPAVYRENGAAVNFLRSLGEDIDVIITHHMPTRRSVHPIYEGTPANIYFLCDVWDSIVSVKPRVVIHGHTHKEWDYILNNIRVICHPRGYPRENDFGEEGYKPVTIEI